MTILIFKYNFFISRMFCIINFNFIFFIYTQVLLHAWMWYFLYLVNSWTVSFVFVFLDTTNKALGHLWKYKEILICFKCFCWHILRKKKLCNILSSVVNIDLSRFKSFMTVFIILFSQKRIIMLLGNISAYIL